jgi:NTP pyrophosphatase (non-canonical NTP hydrolase)|tara:strand:- start:1961 stop:2437 length:477 start_codon:yes stop_codon:yes gene_type:complete
MLLNIFAEPVSRVITQRLKTLKRLSTTLKMNSSTQHCTNQSLGDQAIQFRNSYGIQNSVENRTMQRDLIAEEYREFIDATISEPYDAELKELADLVYVCFQYAENMEWDLEEALHRVHKSNMSKLGLDGTPIRRADGKVLKGPNYQPPTLTDLVTNVH